MMRFSYEEEKRGYDQAADKGYRAMSHVRQATMILRLFAAMANAVTGKKDQLRIAFRRLNSGKRSSA